jgi:hypothetical protein
MFIAYAARVVHVHRGFFFFVACGRVKVVQQKTPFTLSSEKRLKNIPRVTCFTKHLFIIGAPVEMLLRVVRLTDRGDGDTMVAT